MEPTAIRYDFSNDDVLPQIDILEFTEEGRFAVSVDLNNKAFQVFNVEGTSLIPHGTPISYELKIAHFYCLHAVALSGGITATALFKNAKQLSILQCDASSRTVTTRELDLDDPSDGKIMEAKFIKDPSNQLFCFISSVTESKSTIFHLCQLTTKAGKVCETKILENWRSLAGCWTHPFISENNELCLLSLNGQQNKMIVLNMNDYTEFVCDLNGCERTNPDDPSFPPAGRWTTANQVSDDEIFYYIVSSMENTGQIWCLNKKKLQWRLWFVIPEEDTVRGCLFHKPLKNHRCLKASFKVKPDRSIVIFGAHVESAEVKGNYGLLNFFADSTFANQADAPLTIDMLAIMQSNDNIIIVHGNKIEHNYDRKSVITRLKIQCTLEETKSTEQEKVAIFVSNKTDWIQKNEWVHLLQNWEIYAWKDLVSNKEVDLSAIDKFAKNLIFVLDLPQNYSRVWLAHRCSQTFVTLTSEQDFCSPVPSDQRQPFHDNWFCLSDSLPATAHHIPTESVDTKILFADYEKSFEKYERLNPRLTSTGIVTVPLIGRNEIAKHKNNLLKELKAIFPDGFLFFDVSREQYDIFASKKDVLPDFCTKYFSFDAVFCHQNHGIIFVDYEADNPDVQIEQTKTFFNLFNELCRPKVIWDESLLKIITGVPKNNDDRQQLRNMKNKRANSAEMKKFIEFLYIGKSRFSFSVTNHINETAVKKIKAEKGDKIQRQKHLPILLSPAQLSCVANAEKLQVIIGPPRSGKSLVILEKSLRAAREISGGDIRIIARQQSVTEIRQHFMKCNAYQRTPIVTDQIFAKPEDDVFCDDIVCDDEAVEFLKERRRCSGITVIAATNNKYNEEKLREAKFPFDKAYKLFGRNQNKITPTILRCANKSDVHQQIYSHLLNYMQVLKYTIEDFSIITTDEAAAEAVKAFLVSCEGNRPSAENAGIKSLTLVDIVTFEKAISLHWIAVIAFFFHEDAQSELCEIREQALHSHALQQITLIQEKRQQNVEIFSSQMEANESISVAKHNPYILKLKEYGDRFLTAIHGVISTGQTLYQDAMEVIKAGIREYIVEPVQALMEKYTTVMKILQVDDEDVAGTNNKIQQLDESVRQTIEISATVLVIIEAMLRLVTSILRKLNELDKEEHSSSKINTLIMRRQDNRFIEIHGDCDDCNRKLHKLHKCAITTEETRAKLWAYDSRAYFQYIRLLVKECHAKSKNGFAFIQQLEYADSASMLRSLRLDGFAENWMKMEKPLSLLITTAIAKGTLKKSKTKIAVPVSIRGIRKRRMMPGISLPSRLRTSRGQQVLVGHHDITDEESKILPMKSKKAPPEHHRHPMASLKFAERQPCDNLSREEDLIAMLQSKTTGPLAIFPSKRRLDSLGIQQLRKLSAHDTSSEKDLSSSSSDAIHDLIRHHARQQSMFDPFAKRSASEVTSEEDSSSDKADEFLRKLKEREEFLGKVKERAAFLRGQSSALNKQKKMRRRLSWPEITQLYQEVDETGQEIVKHAGEKSTIQWKTSDNLVIQMNTMRQANQPFAFVVLG